MEKINVTISETVLSIINNDACVYFPTENSKSGKPSINGLLNRIIPSLLDVRKERRAKIESLIKKKGSLSAFDPKTEKRILAALEETFDSVYFDDDENYRSAGQLSIRPLNENQAAFDEIADDEARIMGVSVSACFSSMLNEYTRLPEYKRQQVIFYKALKLFHTAVDKHMLYCCRVDGSQIKLFPLVSKVVYSPEQYNVISGLSADGKDTLEVLNVKDIEAPYLSDGEFASDYKGKEREAKDFLDANLYTLKSEYKLSEWRKR